MKGNLAIGIRMAASRIGYQSHVRLVCSNGGRKETLAARGPVNENTSVSGSGRIVGGGGSPPGTRAKILVVEDDVRMHSIFGEILGEENYEVFLADSARRGLDIFRREKPNLVLTDIRMEGMDGIELMKAIKEESPQTRVVIMTAYGSEEMARKSLLPQDPKSPAVKADSYLTKPLDYSYLLVVIERELHDQQIESERNQARAIVQEQVRWANMGEGAAAVAHDVNNLLCILWLLPQGVGLLVAKLRSELGEGCGGGDELLTMCNKLEQEVEIANKTVEEIKSMLLSFLDLGRRSFEEERFSLNEAILAAKTLASFRFKEKGVFLEIELDDSIPDILGNKQDFMNVILNLWINALYVTPAEGRIKMASKREEGGILIEVSDTGQGIPEEIQPRIFEKFFTSKPPEIGTGLGLATAKETVEKMGGTISFVTEENKGTTFSLYFPLATE